MEISASEPINVIPSSWATILIPVKTGIVAFTGTALVTLAS